MRLYEIGRGEVRAGLAVTMRGVVARTDPVPVDMRELDLLYGAENCRGYVMYYDPSGDFRPGAYFGGIAVRYGLDGETWTHGTIFVSLQSGLFRRVDRYRKRLEMSNARIHRGGHMHVRASAEALMNKIRLENPRIIERDAVKDITVDGQTAIILDCANCGTLTPHGRNVDGQAYCGICGCVRP